MWRGTEGRNMERDGHGASLWRLAGLQLACVEKLGQENLCQGAGRALGGGLAVSLSQHWAEHSNALAGSGPSSTLLPLSRSFPGIPLLLLPSQR